MQSNRSSIIQPDFLMRMRFPIFSLACVAVAGLFALNGCKKSTPSTNEVVVWHWMTDRDAALQKLAAQYQKETGVQVRLELYAPSHPSLFLIPI